MDRLESKFEVDISKLKHASNQRTRTTKQDPDNWEMLIITFKDTWIPADEFDT
jgi:hypothetical protein